MNTYTHEFVYYTSLFIITKGHEAENLQKECLFLLYYH